MPNADPAAAADAGSTGHVPQIVRVFRIVDAMVALFFIIAVAHGVIRKVDLFGAVDPGSTAEGWIRHLAHAAITPVMGLLSLALLAVTVFPAHRPRHHAIAAVVVAGLGFIFLACSVAVPWAFDQGWWPMVLGGGLIVIGMVAHLALAALLWRVAAPAP